MHRRATSALLDIDSKSAYPVSLLHSDRNVMANRNKRAKCHVCDKNIVVRSYNDLTLKQLDKFMRHGERVRDRGHSGTLSRSRVSLSLVRAPFWHAMLRFRNSVVKHCAPRSREIVQFIIRKHRRPEVRDSIWLSRSCEARNQTSDEYDSANFVTHQLSTATNSLTSSYIESYISPGHKGLREQRS